jgi:plasmid maintenance system antidote protein VapI
LTRTRLKPQRSASKTRVIKEYNRKPNYIYLLPPGEELEEKLFELGWDAAELARRMNVSVETVEQLIRVEIPLTQDLADRIETATMMYASHLMKLETSFRADYAYAMEHPEIPAYRGNDIINQPKKIQRKKCSRS